ncbi:MAG TPA: hypothetical protein VKT49_21645 [Bryobacteraceae bacterium]|nr:hypothetical protein [Bryobacteraceae bacterium]
MICPMEKGDPSELLAYSAQQLEGSESLRLRQHVNSCPACREFVSGQEAVWRALDAWEAPAISADFDPRLYRRIAQESSWRERCLHALGPLLVRQGLPIAAAACLIIVAGFVSRQPPNINTAPQKQAAQIENLQPEQVEHVMDDMQMLSDFARAARSDTGEL